MFLRPGLYKIPTRGFFFHVLFREYPSSLSTTVLKYSNALATTTPIVLFTVLQTILQCIRATEAGFIFLLLDHVHIAFVRRFPFDQRSNCAHYDGRDYD